MKTIVANLIWRVARISPKWGNRVMDILGYDNYCRVAKRQTLSRKESN
jgi:hypothetical protein